MKSTLFSVLIANYNNGRFLDAAIQSVFSQTYENWELIIVDDFSTDKISKNVYSQYSNNPRIHIFFHDENKGVGYTKRELIQLSHGDIFAFLDADDELYPNALEIMVDAHSKNPDCSLIHSKYVHLYGINELCSANLPIGPQSGEPDDLLVCSQSRVHHFATIKRSCYNQTVGMDQSLPLAEDLDLYYKMEEVGDIGFVNEFLYKYRMDNTNSISIGHEKQKRGLYYVSLAHLNAYKRRLLSHSPRCERFKEEYSDYILADIRRVRDSKSCNPIDLFHYIGLYLSIAGWHLQSLKRSLKIIIGK